MYRFLLILFFTPLFLTAQKTAHKFDGVIYYKDGSTKSGFISLIDDKIVFRPTRKSKEKTKIDATKIDKIKFGDKNDTNATFFFKQLANKNSDKTIPVTRLLEGNVSLYLYYSSGINANNGGYETLRYYVAKKDEQLSLILPTGIAKTSDRAIKEYFDDCPKIGEYIDKKAFQKIVDNNAKLRRSEKVPRRLKDIVNYYNSNCAN